MRADRGSIWLRLLAAALLAQLFGCAVRLAPPPAPSVHLSDEVQAGDATRRASNRLLVQGLDADTAGRSNAALSAYERAIQVDATNPYAYLALARHEVEAEHWGRALEALDQAELLFGSKPDPGVQAHLDGLRGATALGKGYGAEAQPLLDRASRQAPAVWGDGHLSADELR